MSDIALTANRVIPITVELYDFSVVEFPDLNVIGKDDSEYKLQFTCRNKGTSPPYTVADSDLSTTDKQEIVFTTFNGAIIIRKATFGSNGTDGIIFFICQLNDMNTIGIWKARPRFRENDVDINYPDTPFLIE